MPKNYSIPEWFSETYERRMNSLMALVIKDFHSPAHIDSSYLKELKESDDPEEQALFDLLVSRRQPVWHGTYQNIGVNSISTREPSAFKFLLPTFLICAVEIHDAKPSPAEITDMPLLIAERLLPVGPSIYPGDYPGDFSTAFADYTEGEMQAISGVLDLIAMRNDAASRIAKLALERFWNRYLPLWTSVADPSPG